MMLVTIQALVLLLSEARMRILYIFDQWLSRHVSKANLKPWPGEACHDRRSAHSCDKAWGVVPRELDTHCLRNIP